MNIITALWLIAFTLAVLHIFCLQGLTTAQAKAHQQFLLLLTIAMLLAVFYL